MDLKDHLIPSHRVVVVEKQRFAAGNVHYQIAPCATHSSVCDLWG